MDDPKLAEMQPNVGEDVNAGNAGANASPGPDATGAELPAENGEPTKRIETEKTETLTRDTDARPDTEEDGAPGMPEADPPSEVLPPPEAEYKPLPRVTWQSIRDAFARGGDPLAYQIDPAKRETFRALVRNDPDQYPDADAEFRKAAVAAYFARLSEYPAAICYQQFDTMAQKFFGKPTSPDAAYAKIQELLHPAPAGTAEKFWEGSVGFVQNSFVSLFEGLAKASYPGIRGQIYTTQTGSIDPETGIFMSWRGQPIPSQKEFEEHVKAQDKLLTEKTGKLLDNLQQLKANNRDLYSDETGVLDNAAAGNYFTAYGKLCQYIGEFVGQTLLPLALVDTATGGMGAPAYMVAESYGGAQIDYFRQHEDEDSPLTGELYSLGRAAITAALIAVTGGLSKKLQAAEKAAYQYHFFPQIVNALQKDTLLNLPQITLPQVFGFSLKSAIPHLAAVTAAQIGEKLLDLATGTNLRKRWDEMSAGEKAQFFLEGLDGKLVFVLFGVAGSAKYALRMRAFSRFAQKVVNREILTRWFGRVYADDVTAKPPPSLPYSGEASGAAATAKPPPQPPTPRSGTIVSPAAAPRIPGLWTPRQSQALAIIANDAAEKFKDRAAALAYPYLYAAEKMQAMNGTAGAAVAGNAGAIAENAGAIASHGSRTDGADTDRHGLPRTNTDQSSQSEAAASPTDTNGSAQEIAERDQTLPEPQDPEREINGATAATEADERQAWRKALPHDPDESAARVDASAPNYPGIHIVKVDHWEPEQIADITRRGVILARLAPALYDPQNNRVLVNVSVVRPSDVDRVIRHEVETHYGLDALLGSHAPDFYDHVFRVFANNELMLKGIRVYKLAPVDAEGNLDLGAMSTDQKREAAAEFCAAYRELHYDPDAPRPKWYQRAFSLLKELLQHYLPRLRIKLLEQDVLNLLDSARRAARKKRARRKAEGEKRFAFPDASGEIRQEFGIRNSQLEDGVKLNSVAVETTNFVSTAKSPAEVAAHHLRTSDADAELRRRINAANQQGSNYTIHNDDSQMTAVVGKNDSGEMRHRYQYSTVPGYVYAAAMVNIEPLFRKAKLCLSHDDRYQVNPDGSVNTTGLQQVHRFFVVMTYEGKSYAVKLTAKEWKDGHNSLYSLQTHETEITEIKSAPADGSPTGGVVESAQADQSKLTFGQIKDLFNLSEGYHPATKITFISEKSRLAAEENARFLKKNIKDQKKSDGDTGSGGILHSLASEEERDAVASLRPLVGRSMLLADEQYTEYLRQRGFDVDEHEAHLLAYEAMQENKAAAWKANEARRKARRAAEDKKRDDWLYENVPFYRHAVDFAGPGFKIQLSPRVARGADADTGTFLARGKQSGTPSDELARYIAAKTGDDELAVEEEIAEFFRTLTKPELYKLYHDFKREKITADKDLDRQLREEYFARIEDEAVRVLTEGKPLTMEYLKENRNVLRVLYNRLFNRDLKGSLSQRDLDAINAAIVQQSMNPAEFAKAFRAARTMLLDEFTAKFREWRENFISDTASAKDLQQQAKELLMHELPPELRSRFFPRILGLAKLSSAPTRQYPEGHRAAAFDALMKEIAEAAENARRERTLAQLQKRLDTLNRRVDSGRRAVGTRTIESQNLIDRIREIVSFSPGDIDFLTQTAQQDLEAALDAGNAEAARAAETELALLRQFGNLARRPADDARAAREALEKIAITGRNSLLAQIAQRRADDAKITDLVVDRVTNDVGIKTDQDAFDAKWRDPEPSNFLSRAVYGLFKLEDYFYLLSTNHEKGDWLDNPVGQLFAKVHSSAVAEATRLRKYGDFRNAILDHALGSTNPISRAAKLQKLRERIPHTGILRMSAEQRKITYDYYPVSVVRQMLADYDAGKRGTLAEYQAELLRDKLRDLDMKVAKTRKPDEIDKVTEEVYNAMEREISDAADAAGKEKMIGIPSVSFEGPAYEMQHLTQLEALYLDLLWKQRDTRYKMFFNGFSEETAKQISDFLLPETRKLGDAMVRYLDGQGTELSGVTERLYFSPLPRVEHYFPAVYENRSVSGQKRAPSLDDPGAAGAPPQRLAPGSLKLRTGHLMEPKIADALTVFENSVRRSLHFIEWAETARELRGALLRPEIKLACDQVFGSGFFPQLRDSIIDTINGGNADLVYNQALQSLYANGVSVKMMFGYLSGIKQTMSAIAYANDMPVGAFVTNLADAWLHPSETIGLLLRSDYLKNRFQSGPDLFQKLALDTRNRFALGEGRLARTARRIGVDPSVAAGVSQAFEVAKDWSGIYTRLGDATPVVLAGAAAYRYHYKKLIAQGVPEAEARKQAMVRWEIATESLQQSSAVHNQNSWQRGGLLTKTFSAWKSAQILGNQRILRELVAGKIFGGRDADAEIPGRTATAAKAWIISAVTAALISAVGTTALALRRRNHRNDDAEKIFSDALVAGATDCVQWLPVAGQLLDAMLSNRRNTDSMFLDEFLGAYQKTKAWISPARRSRKSDSERLFDAVAADLAALGFLSPAFAVPGTMMRRGKQLWELATGSGK